VGQLAQVSWLWLEHEAGFPLPLADNDTVVFFFPPVRDVELSGPTRRLARLCGALGDEDEADDGDEARRLLQPMCTPLR